MWHKPHLLNALADLLMLAAAAAVLAAVAVWVVRVPALPVRLLQLHLCLVYWLSVSAKTGDTWLDGSAVWHAVQSADFARPTGAWLVAHANVPHSARA